jgi:hypothetical protein
LITKRLITDNINLLRRKNFCEDAVSFLEFARGGVHPGAKGEERRRCLQKVYAPGAYFEEAGHLCRDHGVSDDRGVRENDIVSQY